MDELKHQGVKGMHWGIHKEQKKTGKGRKKKSVRSFIKKSRAIRARMDVEHVDAKTGEYTNNSKTAKSLRVLDKILGLAAVGVGTTALMMNDNQDNHLKHTGVKGMHWGVRRNADRPGGADGIPDKGEKKRSKIGKHIDSIKRERSWGKVLKEIHTMPTKDINTIKKRLDLENSLKSLTKSKMATKKDKHDYLRRHEMSDQELNRKINRLRAKDNFHESVQKATKEQRELGAKVVQIAGSVGAKYAINRKVTIKDAFDIVGKPKDSSEKAKKDVVSAGLTRAQRSGKLTGVTTDDVFGVINMFKKPKDKK